jgi:hypothetical protein
MFRHLSAKYFEPISMWIIILGIVCLCQPWVLFLHVYAFLIIIIGLIGFIFFSHIQPLSEEVEEE